MTGSSPPGRTAAALPTASRPLFIFAALLVALLLLALVLTVAGTVMWILLSGSEGIPDPARQWPRLTNLAIVAIPVVALLLGAMLARQGGGNTFYSQQRTNRRVALLFLVALIGLLTALGEVIAASITFDAYGALVGAGIAALVGVGAAAFAHVMGADTVLASAGARSADRATDPVLLNVVNELSIAANMPPPSVYVIEDESLNAMAVGTRPGNAALAVTRGMVNQFDREQLQGVVAHELAHIRNLDSRYGVYVAILVGLVALVTDGFLRMVIEAWRHGMFFKGAELADDDAKGALAGLAAGVLFGILLLLLAAVLRIFAPIAAVLVQAAVSRQREFLADATSVELTRNPVGLARALDALKNDRDPLDGANRGTQHLWFSSPVKPGGDDTSWHLLATHPSLDARIGRLATLFPAGVETATDLADEPLPAPVPAAAGPEG